RQEVRQYLDACTNLLGRKPRSHEEFVLACRRRKRVLAGAAQVIHWSTQRVDFRLSSLELRAFPLKERPHTTAVLHQNLKKFRVPTRGSIRIKSIWTNDTRRTLKGMRRLSLPPRL